ncbi:MAG TPA: hypothetical protein VI757_02830 [Bacteroidia bacterium]|nr:hypothetical protein [Bacteroidia bacterium]
MQTINSEATLKDAIVQLEHKRTYEEKILREQFHLACESMKPLNLIKSTFKDAFTSGKDAAASPDFKDNIVNTSVGLAAGYLSKLLFVNVSHSPIRKLLGIALQFGITALVAKNPEAIKSMGKGVINIRPLAKLKK